MKLKLITVGFVLVGIAYFFWPIDLIPDIFGLLGRVDDILVLIALYWRYKVIVRRYLEQIKFYKEKLQTESKSSGSPRASMPKSNYEILEISEGSTQPEIEKAYKRLVQLYHPDKVNHLGSELKELAHNKMLEIQKAYEALSRD
ncbi:MAG: DnaJ domain-containing protein [Bdellovibrionales bacterium]|nr:DnaJ domain-containing protein [Bdellovibrionales bacterium]